MYKSQKVMGLRVSGSELFPQEISVDQTFEKCPIAHAAGMPIYVKRLQNEPRVKSSRYIIVRIMSDPAIGLAQDDWQYGGMLPPAPTVLMARSDGIDFELGDWTVLDDFQMAMLNDGPRKVTRKDFLSFAKCYSNKEPNLILQALYPKGSSCMIKGLEKNVDLNGKTCTCIGVYGNGRIGVAISNIEKPVSIKISNLELILNK